jgi:hypothetical protein
MNDFFITPSDAKFNPEKNDITLTSNNEDF